MSNGGGLVPTGVGGFESQIRSAGPPANPTGINVGSAGNITQCGQHHVTENRGCKWVEVKGSKHEIGLRAKFHFTLGLDHSITLGLKTKVTAGDSNVHIHGFAFTEMFAAKYESIFPKKVETVYGKKLDAQTAVGRKYESNNGPRTEVTAKKQKDEQVELQELSAALETRVGSLLKIETQSLIRDIKKAELRGAEANRSIPGRLVQKADQLRARCKQMKEDIKKLEKNCGEFTEKMSDMKLATNAALEIRCSKSGNHGNLIKMNASVQKFMASLIKLGE